MITGAVQGDEARIRVSVQGPNGNRETVVAVIDTGFSASLCLPPNVVAALELRWQSFGRGILADGSQCLFDVYEATIKWDGKPRRVLVDEAETDPLIGMALLSGYELKIQVRPRGKVTIQRLR